MIDLEKVVKGLECCMVTDEDLCTDCPYNDPTTYEYGENHCLRKELMPDAIALLKKQQQQIWELQDQVEYLTDKQKEQKHGETFTVIDTKTGKEADTYNIALHEDWAKHLCYCDMEGWAIEEDGTLLLVDECGQFAYADRERFKVKWDG